MVFVQIKGVTMGLSMLFSSGWKYIVGGHVHISMCSDMFFHIHNSIKSRKTPVMNCEICLTLTKEFYGCSTQSFCCLFESTLEGNIGNNLIWWTFSCWACEAGSKNITMQVQACGRHILIILLLISKIFSVFLYILRGVVYHVSDKSPLLMRKVDNN